jgi:hypothetical protein
MRYLTKLKLATAHEVASARKMSSLEAAKYMMEVCGVKAKEIIEFAELPSSEIKQIREDCVEYLKFVGQFDGLEL